jgi:hypothetical protein
MDKNIGRTWKNGNGDERKVVALSSINNVKRYLIGTGRGEASPEADRMPEICSISDIDALIARETKMYEANSEFRKRQEEQRLREAKLEKDRTSLDGFEYTLSNMMRGKAIAALTKSVRHDGRIIPLRDLIRMKVKEGWRVKTSASGARRLEKDGVFLDAKAVTKIGLDYAEHLSNKTDKAEELTMPNTVNNTDVAAIGTMVNDFIAALQLATPGKKVMFPWKGRITKATAMQVGLLAKRIASVFPDFTAHLNTAKKAIEIYTPQGATLSKMASALLHPKDHVTASASDVKNNAEKLVLWINNDRNLYGRLMGAYKLLVKIKARKSYDKDKAIKFLMKIVDDGAKSYHAEGVEQGDYTPGGKWNKAFPTEERKLAAILLEREIQTDSAALYDASASYLSSIGRPSLKNYKETKKLNDKLHADRVRRKSHEYDDGVRLPSVLAQLMAYYIDRNEPLRKERDKVCAAFRADPDGKHKYGRVEELAAAFLPVLKKAAKGFTEHMSQSKDYIRKMANRDAPFTVTKDLLSRTAILMANKFLDNLDSATEYALGSHTEKSDKEARKPEETKFHKPLLAIGMTCKKSAAVKHFGKEATDHFYEHPDGHRAVVTHWVDGDADCIARYKQSNGILAPVDISTGPQVKKWAERRGIHFKDSASVKHLNKFAFTQDVNVKAFNLDTEKQDDLTFKKGDRIEILPKDTVVDFRIHGATRIHLGEVTKGKGNYRIGKLIFDMNVKPALTKA